MFALRFARVVLPLVGMLLAGCSTDNGALSAQSSAQPAPLSDVTLDDYLRSHGVTAQPQTIEDAGALRISVQQPAGWLAYDSIQIPNTYVVLTDKRAIDQGFAPNTVVIVHKLDGNFDPREAILRGFVDTERYKNFKKTRSSLADFDGFPSSVIEGTYDDDKDLSLHVLNRYVLVVSGDQRFVVLLTITTTAQQAPQLADDVKGIDEGLKIVLK